MPRRRQLKSGRYRLRVPRLTNGLYRTITSTRYKQRERPTRQMSRHRIRPSRFRRKGLQWLVRTRAVTRARRRTYRRSSRLLTGRLVSNVPTSRNRIATSSTRQGDGSLRDSPSGELFRYWFEVHVLRCLRTNTRSSFRSLRLRLSFCSGGIKRDSSTDKHLERRRVDLLALMDVDRAPCVSVEARVE